MLTNIKKFVLTRHLAFCRQAKIRLFLSEKRIKFQPANLGKEKNKEHIVFIYEFTHLFTLVLTPGFSVVLLLFCGEKTKRASAGLGSINVTFSSFEYVLSRKSDLASTRPYNRRRLISQGTQQATLVGAPENNS